MVALSSDWMICPLISSSTAEWNLMKVYRKQELKVLYQFCVNWEQKLALFEQDINIVL